MSSTTASTALVLGFGVSGEAVSRRLSSTGEPFAVVDDFLSPITIELARSLGALAVGTLEDVLGLLGSGWPTVAIVSPGIRPDHRFHRLGIETLSEIDFGYRLSSAKPIAVTGTNGKTTVSTLITEILNTTGRPTILCGNSGVPYSAVSDSAQTAVVELSSFQLHYTHEFAAHIACWLNFSPDHLDWHGSIEGYLVDKQKIWQNQDRKDYRVVNADDKEVSQSPRSNEPAELSFSISSKADFSIHNGEIYGPNGMIVPISLGRRTNPHDISNFLAAFAVSHAAGVGPSAMREVFEAFEGLEHRLELCRTLGGVRFFNDSKATTPASVVAALAGLGSVVLIAGGRAKGLDFSEVAKVAERVRAVVAIGESADEVIGAFQCFAPATSLYRANGMREAVQLAFGLAKPEDAILLSPGATSYDWYRNYSERGRDFKYQVDQLAVSRGTTDGRIQ